MWRRWRRRWAPELCPGRLGHLSLCSFPRAAGAQPALTSNLPAPCPLLLRAQAPVSVPKDGVHGPPTETS